MAKASLESVVRITLELDESEAQGLYNLLNLGVEYDSLKKGHLYEIFRVLDDLSELEDVPEILIFKTRAELA